MVNVGTSARTIGVRTAKLDGHLMQNTPAQKLDTPVRLASNSLDIAVTSAVPSAENMQELPRMEIDHW